MPEFSLSDSQNKMCEEWLESHNKEIISAQLIKFKNWPFIIQMIKDSNQPYDGAIGSRVTYMFTPNGVGCVIKVIDNLMPEGEDKVLDLSDYENW